MDSEKTAAQKELVKKLTEDLHRLEDFKTMLTKFVMDDRNSGNANIERANTTLARLKAHLAKHKEQLQIADSIWLGCQLDDLEAELSAE